MAEELNTALSAIRDVLVGLTEEGCEDDSNASVGYGLSLAAAAGAHLTVESCARRVTTESRWLRTLVAAENRRLAELARAAAERVASDAALGGVDCTVEARSLFGMDLMARLGWQARLHDLTILDATPLSQSLDRRLIEVALFQSGRPVIVVPPSHNAFRVQRLLVAWDGSAQAARAVREAMPLLRAAEQVDVVSVVREKELPTSATSSELAPHLARHGVKATAEDIPAAGDAAEALRARALAGQADIIVMGAFRHSRVREWFFGGVTRSLLESSPLPLFMTH